MVDKLSAKLAACLCSGVFEGEKDRARVQYGLKILISEGLKFFSLVLLFTALRHEKYFYFSLLILLSTRVFSGGIHVKGTLNCLVLTALLFLCTSTIAPQVPSLPAAYSLCTLLLYCYVRFSMVWFLSLSWRTGDSGMPEGGLMCRS